MQKQISDEMLELVAQRLRLLSDPMRLKILHQLQSGERSVSELVELTKASQPNVSKHLSGLRTHGLVKRRQEGNMAYFSISDPFVFEIRSEEHTSELQSRPHLVCRLLLEKNTHIR